MLGIVPVFAAGNSGDKPKTMGTPGGFPHSFAVSATDSSDKIAYFSSRGPIMRRKLHKTRYFSTWSKGFISKAWRRLPTNE